MEGRRRRSFTDDYKRQAVDLVASSGRSIGIGGQGTWPARFGVAVAARATWGQAGADVASRMSACLCERLREIGDGTAQFVVFSI
jgi:hypothetical protein